MAGSWCVVCGVTCPVSGVAGGGGFGASCEPCGVWGQSFGGWFLVSGAPCLVLVVVVGGGGGGNIAESWTQSSVGCLLGSPNLSPIVPTIPTIVLSRGPYPPCHIPPS